MSTTRTHQLSLALIPHTVAGQLIEQRSSDGYFNATAVCKAAGKQLGHYLENQSTKDFLAELSSVIGIPISELIQVVKGGDPGRQGTWVHPDVAANLGQWVSPRFAVMVSQWVREWVTGGKFAGGTIPYHLQRYMANRTKVPYTHFSVLNELTIGLIAPLEDQGYRLPENMIPDISQGKMFAKWMRESIGMDTDTLPVYEHEYADGRVVMAKMYPIAFIDMFRKHFNEVWIPQKAIAYFRERDKNALPYLDAMLSLPVEVKYTLPAPSGAKRAPRKVVKRIGSGKKP